MEPVTHVLTGACLARSGLNRRVAYATLGMAIAAELPDIDTLWSLRGPISGFEHHRGITHTFLGIPFEAALLLGGLFMVHHVRVRRRRSQEHTQAKGTVPLTAAPVRWLALYGCLLLALLSHLLLDYTNNYGLRPFFPFNTHWYAASIVFIFDPLLFLFLLAGLLLPTLFGLVAREVGERRRSFAPPGWPRVALACVVVLWTVRSYEHGRAVALGEAQTLRAPATDSELQAESTADSNQDATAPQTAVQARPLLMAERTLASPDPLSVFRWYTATDFGPVYQLGTADTASEALTSEQVLNKPIPGALLKAAEESHLGRVYLDWSMLPWITVASSGGASAGPDQEVTVSFRDLRFMGSTSLLHRNGTTPLTGTVVLTRSGQVLSQAMDGKPGH